MSRRVIIAAVGGFVAVMLLWYVLLWAPRRSDLAEARDRAADAATTRDALQLQLSQLQGLQERSTLIQSRLEELRAAVPDRPDLAQFILDADAAARRAGIAFLSIAPTVPVPVVEVAGVSAVSMQISVSGQYFQVLDWMNRLNDLGRIVVIDSLSFSGASEDSLTVAVTARMFTANVAPPPVLTATATGA